MTNTDKLEILRACNRSMDKTGSLQASLDYAIQCIEAVQSRRTLTPAEITEPGLYLAKTADGEVIALRVHADQINLGTVFLGFTFQGPIVWEEHPG
jgi:hypothetical protein